MVTADPWSEAEVVAGLVEQSNAGLCVADAGMIPNHERAIRRKGFLPYDPAGKPLAPFECATLSRLWLAFRANGKIGELRALSEHPVFLHLLCRESNLTSSAALLALDELETKILVETVSDATAYLEQTASPWPKVAARRRRGAVESEIRRFPFVGRSSDISADRLFG